MLEPKENLSVSVCGIRSQNEGAEVSISLLLSDGVHSEKKQLLLTMEQYLQIRPEKGEISPELYETLEEASQYCMALRCGAGLLAYGASPVEALKRKIVQHGYPEDLALAVAKKLEEMGFINEEEILAREVEKCVKKLWGGARIRSFLWTKGFGKQALSQLPEMLLCVNFSENCAKLIRKHYGEVPTDAEERRRLAASLTRYGYSISDIREAFRILR